MPKPKALCYKRNETNRTVFSSVRSLLCYGFVFYFGPNIKFIQLCIFYKRFIYPYNVIIHKFNDEINAA